MLKKSLARLFRSRNKNRPVGRHSSRLRVAQFEQLEIRQLLTANVATGYGTFQYVEDLASDFGGMVVDINSDGALDVIGDSVHIRNGDGWLTFADGPGVGKLVDIDGDNDLDVVRDQYWVENLGGGTSWAQHVVDTVNPNDIVYVSSDAADFDGDGDMDVVVALKDWVYWHENVNGDGSEWVGHEVYRSGVFDYVATAAADMDNDGDMDIVIGTRWWYISWAENTGDGSFMTNDYNEIGLVSDDGDNRSALHLNVGDFDQDGRTDLFAVGVDSTNGPVCWFTPKDDPTQQFRRTVVGRLHNADSKTTSVDIDQDGQLELIVTSRFNFTTGSDKVSVYERTGDFSFTRVDLSGDYIGPITDSGDLDNDGDIDLVGEDFIFWNTGGDFHVETTVVSPNAIANSDKVAIFRIDASHNGQMGDPALLLTGFSFLLDDGSGDVGSKPLDSSEVSNRFASWKIYVDDGDGEFGVSDSLILNLNDFASVANGVIRADLTNSPSFIRQLSPGLTRSSWLEVEMAASGHESGNFRITHLTDQGRLAGQSAEAKRWSSSTVANDDYSPNVTAVLESAGNIAFSLNTVTLNEGTFEPSAVVDLLRIDATHTGLVDGELASLAFRFDDAAGTRQLDSQEVNGLIEYLSIVAEDDSEVIRIENLSLFNGILRVDLPDNDSRLNFLNETKSFRVTIQVGADAINQATRSFKITHLTADSNTERSSVELTSNDAPVTLVSTPDRSATIFTGTEVDVVVMSSISTPVTGQQVTYTVTVSNQHATTGASGIQLQGLLPDNLLNIMLVDLQLSGGANSGRSIGDSLAGAWTDTLSLPQQSSVTYVLTGTLADLGVANRSMEPEFLVSGVSTTLPTALFDTNLDNNQASRSDLVRLSSTGTGEFVDSGVDLANLSGTGAERVNEIALGDLDGDGDIDAIVTRGASGLASYATVLFNDGAGTYSESSQDLGYSNFTGAVLGDFDGDGDLDLYLATSTGVSGVTDDTDRVYLNDGNGVFTQTSQSFNFLTETVEMGDMDGDGDLDIVASGPNQSYTLRHFALGLFGFSNSNGVLDNLEEMKLADVDGDGDLDVVGQKNGLQIYLNEGIYNYSVGSQITSDSVLDFEVGDIDNDGDVDILISKESYLIGPGGGQFDRYLQVIRRAVNNGDGSFSFSDTGSYGSFLDLELGDFDDDGDLDAFLVEEVYAGYDGNPEIYYPDSFVPIGVVGRLWSNNGSGGFSDSGQTLDYNVTPTSAYSYDDFSVTAADVNGDGSLDIVTGDFTSAKVWFNNAAPILTVTDLSVVVDTGSVAGNSGLVSDAAYDSVVLAASVGTVMDNGDGTWSWSLAETSALGTTTVVISATDLSGTSTEVTFELVVGMTPVVSSGISTVNVDEGQTATNFGTFGDPDSAIAPTLAASIGTVNDNGDGTWSWSFDTIDGPDQSQTVTITAADAQGLTATASFTLIVNNQAPIIAVNDTAVTVNEGATAFMSGTISDAGLDTVTLAASIGTVNDNGDGTWSWTFDTSNGPDDSQTVTITATDSDSAVVDTSFELIVNNAGPVLNFDPSSLLLYEGHTASKSGTVADVDGVASLTASQGTVELNVDGTWTWTDIASTSFEVPPQQVVLTATDQDGAVTQRSFTLTVIDVPVTFDFESSDITVNEGETATRTGTYDNPRNEPLNFWSNFGQFTDNGDGTFSWSWSASDGPATQDALYTLGDDDSASGGFFQVTVNNVAPTISSNAAVVTVDEGQAAANWGSFGDVGLDTVSLAASVGTVTDNGDGTWSWSFLTSDGPDESQTVTITATDSDDAASTVSFQVTVIDLPVPVDVPENSQAVVDLTTIVNSAVDFRLFGEAPAGELGHGQALQVGESIHSPDGMARLVMQGDGNLVVYTNGSPTWASGTNPASGTTTTIQSDGNLVITDGDDNILYESNSGGHTGAFARLRVDNTGVPQIVRVDGEILWQGTINRFAGQGTVFSPDPIRPEFVLGADTDLFEIANGDQLQFIASPDFENPTDTDSDGIYEVSVLADDGSGNVIPKTFLVAVSDMTEIPAVESVLVDNGQAQRSMVRSLTVTFDTHVTIDSGAFSLMSSTTGVAFDIADADVSTSVVNGKTVAVLTFNNSTKDIVGGSLADGRYTLTINANKIHAGVDSLATDYIDEFFRLFGDSDGDGDVDLMDYTRFRLTYGKTDGASGFDSAFDFDGDGNINSLDLSAFRRRYGIRILPSRQF